MRADEVAHYLSATKSLSGTPIWIAGSKDNQFRLKWPVIFRGTGGTHLEITYSSGAPYLKYSMMLMVPPPVFRLDVGKELTHMNHRPHPHMIRGHHYHPWELNSPEGRAAIPKSLREALRYDGATDIRTAFDWFCDMVGIASPSSELPEPPLRETLL